MSYVDRLLTHVLNTAQGIPGMEAVEAGAGALASHLLGNTPLSYRQSLSTLREATGNIGGKTSIAEHMMGSLATLPFLPKNPAVAGGLLGGADQALSADPITSASDVGGRAVATGVGAGIGALTGKLLDQAVAAGRAKFGQSSAANVLKREASRATAASENYAKAIAEGQGKAPTPAILRVLNKPDIAVIADELLQTRKFQGMDPHSPEVLDAIYKTLSDQAATAKRGLDAVTPNKANIGRFRLSDIRSAQSELLNAMESAGTVTKPPIMFNVPAEITSTDPVYTRGHEHAFGPVLEGTAGRARGNASQVAIDPSGRATAVSPRDVQGPMGPAFQLRADPERMVRPGVEVASSGMRVQTAPAETTRLPAMMPSYRMAVDKYAGDSRLIDAVKRGSDMVKRAGTDLQGSKNLTKTSREAFAKWAATVSPEERQAAAEGILGGLKQVDKVRWAKLLGVPLMPLPTPALNQAPGLLRTVNEGSRLPTMGLLGVHSMY